MKPILLTAAAAGFAALAGCVAPVGPVEVTRFVQPAAALGHGPIVIEPEPGGDAQSLEFRSYAAAVGRELTRIGYVEQAPGTATAQVAVVRISRQTWQPGREGNPVSVGVGGSTGSYGSGVGVGVLPESAARRHAQTMQLALVPLSDAWSVREMRICVRSLEALPNFARELVDLLEADAQGRLNIT